MLLPIVWCHGTLVCAQTIVCLSLSGSFLSVFVFVWRVLRVSTNQDAGHGQWGTSRRTEHGSGLRAQTQEIERPRMELQRTSIKQKESIPEPTPGALDEFVQEDRVAQWMRLCVGALKEFLEHTGLPLQRPRWIMKGPMSSPPPPVIMY